MSNPVNNNSFKRNGPFEKRIHEIDFIRGILILFVLMDHIFWNLYSYGQSWNPQAFAFFNWYWHSVIRMVVQFFILCLFCFISGVSCAFSKNNWKRGGQMVILALLISVITNLVQSWGIIKQNVRIDFNVIAVLAWSTVTYCFFQEKSYKTLLAFSVGALLFAYIGIPILRSIPGSENAYVPMLWRPEGQADHMALFPYISFFYAGAIFSRFFYKDKKSLFYKRYEFERPICFIGRHTLSIYLGHQLLIIPLFLLINFFVVG